MKRAAYIFALTLTMLPLLAAAQMQETLVTQVPFAFMVGNKRIPAGQCIVHPVGVAGKTLSISSTEGRLSLFSSISEADTGKPAAGYALVFHRYAGHSFLVGIRIEGDPNLYLLPESKAETEMKAQNLSPTDEVLRASLKETTRK